MTDGASGSARSLPDTFGPLGVEPLLSIELPAARSESEPGVESPAALAVPVEAGLLLAIRAPYGEFAGSQLSLIGWDGRTRWVSCSELDVVTWLAAPGAERVLIALASQGGSPRSWYEVAVATGEITATTLPIDAETSLYAWNERVAVFGPFNGTPVDSATQVLRVVDLGQLTQEEIPIPDGVGGLSLDAGMFEFSPAGELVMVSRESGASVPIAVLRDGAWSSDPTDLADAHGVRAAFLYDQTLPTLAGTDSSGAIVWNSDISPLAAEGFQLAASRTVTMVAGCWEPLEGELCLRSELGGVDTATGAVLWRLEGDRGVGPIGDGYAIVTDGEEQGAWLMIDTATGEPVAGQEWDEQGLFSTGCCDDQFNSASRFGGVVVTVHDRRLSVFTSES